MAYNFTFPTAQDKNVVDAIRSAIGRTVTFVYLAGQTECTEPGCSLDPVTNTSTNSFCAVCSGNYYIPIYSGAEINAHVTWGFSEQLGWVAGGQLDEGECRVQIEYTPENVTIVNLTEDVIVDGRTMQKSGGIKLRGVQSINRILIDLIEKEYN